MRASSQMSLPALSHSWGWEQEAVLSEHILLLFILVEEVPVCVLLEDIFSNRVITAYAEIP